MTNAPLDAFTIDQLAAAAWRKSSFSGDEVDCVETALLADGRIAVRNSNAPESDVVFFTRGEMDAWVKGCKAGEFDDVM
ncbi:MAG: DUF397 domain-containing protein [Pseudonocardiaceae bacterium]